jgi:hypothetical protein
MPRAQRLIVRFRIACALAAALLLVRGALPVHASGGVVTDCSSDAQFSSLLTTGGTISFNCGAGPHTILISSQKSINLTTTIDGGGTITLDGQNTYRLFDVGAVLTLRNIVLVRASFNGDGGAIRNNANGTLVLESSTIRDSHATLSGGAILSYGPLTITNSVLEGNTALNGGALYPRFAGAQTVIVNSVLRNNRTTSTTDGWGGALLAWDGAPVTIEASDIYSNTARSGGAIYNTHSVLTLRSNTRLRDNIAGYSGGGLYNQAGTATLTNVTLSGNSAEYYGGGIFNVDGTASLTNVTLSGNRTLTDGGGLYNDLTGTATLDNVTLSSNTAPNSNGGGIFNRGTATLDNVTLSGNGAFGDGGGLYNFGVATLTNVTLSGSLASFNGGGLYNSGSVTLTNVTLSSNSTSGSGGGIYNSTGTTTLTNVTLKGNWARTGGGISRENGSLKVKNTIVANSPVGGDCAGAVTNEGFNLSSDSSCGFNPVPNLMLGPLANNGGPTLTYMPQPGSPAIDFVAAGCPPPDSDQRGAKRPVDGDSNGSARCDAGAVEYGAAVAVVYLPLVHK